MKKATVIRPRPINKQAMLKILRNAVYKQAIPVEREYLATTKTWKNQPKFITELKETFTSIEFFVGTDSELYYLIDITGAVPHIITPVNAQALTIPTNFTPKTKVGVIGSVSGGRSGAIQLRMKVNHPGFEARGFTKVIAFNTHKRFLEEMRKAMQEVVRVSGHAL